MTRQYRQLPYAEKPLVVLLTDDPDSLLDAVEMPIRRAYGHDYMEEIRDELMADDLPTRLRPILALCRVRTGSDLWVDAGTKPARRSRPPRRRDKDGALPPLPTLLRPRVVLGNGNPMRVLQAVRDPFLRAYDDVTWEALVRRVLGGEHDLLELIERYCQVRLVRHVYEAEGEERWAPPGLL